MSRISAPEPKVGQIWVSNDKRDLGFEREVIAVNERYVTLAGRITTSVLRNRMRPISTGFRFVRDAR